jgi:hypothetical protein
VGFYEFGNDQSLFIRTGNSWWPNSYVQILQGTLYTTELCSLMCETSSRVLKHKYEYLSCFIMKANGQILHDD